MVTRRLHPYLDKLQPKGIINQTVNNQISATTLKLISRVNHLVPKSLFRKITSSEISINTNRAIEVAGFAHAKLANYVPDSNLQIHPKTNARNLCLLLA